MKLGLDSLIVIILDSSFQECHHKIDHEFLFLRLGFGNHHSERDERVVGDAL